MSQPPKRLRSALWSSETLIQGMKAISKQPDRMMAPKDELESDDDLALEFQVSCSLKNSTYNLLLYRGCSVHPSSKVLHFTNVKFCKLGKHQYFRVTNPKTSLLGSLDAQSLEALTAENAELEAIIGDGGSAMPPMGEDDEDGLQDWEIASALNDMNAIWTELVW